jgi:hypothetical protein
MDARRLLWLILPLALMALLFAGVACGGDDDDEDTGDDAANQEDNADEDENGGGDDGDSDGDDDASGSDDDDADDGSEDDAGSDDDGSSDDGEDTGDDDNGSGSSGGSGGGSSGEGGGLARLQQTANALTGTTYYVTYAIQAEGLDGTFTFASEPPSTLIGLQGEFEGQSGQFMIITDDEFLWFCSDSDGQQGCLKMKAGNAGLIPVEIPTALQADELAQSFVNAPGVTAEPAPSQTIAGIEGECYNVTSEADTALICVGNDVILLMQGTIDGEAVSFEAQEVETDPAAIEITVPDWPVQDLTAVGN